MKLADGPEAQRTATDLANTGMVKWDPNGQYGVFPRSWAIQDDIVSFVVAQLQGGRLPIQQALEACSQTIATLEQRIAIAQKSLVAHEATRDLLLAALEAQQQPQT